ncbi:hypothetical protein HYQ46_004804 [Verticillium longisporum]|nr:hypothetical protein HYQ46_004804 [Verticillium longisporum]
MQKNSPSVHESKPLSQQTNLFLSTIVHDVDLEFVGRPIHASNVVPGVLKNLYRFLANGKVYVDRRGIEVIDGESFNAVEMRLVVPVAANDANTIGDEEVQAHATSKDSIPVKDRRGQGEEPHARAKSKE